MGLKNVFLSSLCRALEPRLPFGHLLPSVKNAAGEGTFFQRSHGLIYLIAFTYLLFEWLFIPHTALVRDEFWFAHHIYQYTQQIPYRDFIPYKSILGYYLYTLPFFFSFDALSPLYYIKKEIALINAVMLLGIGGWATKYFNSTAVLLTLGIILSSHLFLITSVDLRIDMLASWLGLISVLLIFSERTYLSGIAIGLAFLVSPKALWFWVATNIGFIFIKKIRDLRQFNFAGGLVLSAFVIICSCFANFHNVIHSLFYDSYIQASLTWYQHYYKACWHTILSLGPIFMLWPLCLLSLWNTAGQSQQRRFILLYSTCILFFIISYQQPFLYNMVLAIPAGFLLYAEFFTWLRSPSSPMLAMEGGAGNRGKLFLIIYSISILGLTYYLNLSKAYYLILVLPIFLKLILNGNKEFIMPMLISIIFLGIIYPFIATMSNAYAYYNAGSYQKYNILLANQLLDNNDEYLAGTPLFYKRKQHISGLDNLIGPQLDYIGTASKKVTPILLSSLNLAAKTSSEIVNDLKQHPIKLFINNNRIESLPMNIKDYLNSQYQHFWGSIFLYAPLITPHQKTFTLKFNGIYQVSGKGKIYIDKKLAASNAKIWLPAGKHQTYNAYAYRLKFQPSINEIRLNTKFQNYHSEKLGSI